MKNKMKERIQASIARAKAMGATFTEPFKYFPPKGVEEEELNRMMKEVEEKSKEDQS